MDKWAAMDELTKQSGMTPDEIPEHAFTRQEYQERYGLARSGAEARLRRLVDQGVLHQGLKRVSKGHRSPWVNFYWVPKPAEAVKQKKGR